MSSLHLKVLPLAQAAIWQGLGVIPSHFVLYGGTAIALRLGHRQSIDFDFFTHLEFVGTDLFRSIELFKDARITQLEKNTLSIIVDRPGPVKISFFGGISCGRVGVPEIAPENQIRLASLTDLFGHKVKVVLQRVEAKDYRDIVALLKSGLSLKGGFEAALGIFGSSFPPSECAKALTYFEGGDLISLSNPEKQTLRSAVRQLPRRFIPIPLLSKTLN